MSAGQEKVEALRSAGFTDAELATWASGARADLESAGFSSKEISEYFGEKNPDMSPVKAMIEENLKGYTPVSTFKPLNSTSPTAKAPGKAKRVPFVAGEEPVEAADSFFEALEAGLQISTAGLVFRADPPSLMVPEHAPMFHRIASQLGTLAGDLPAMVAGSLAGSIAGAAAVPAAAPVGAAVGGGAGSFALPAALRQTLMDYYRKGEIKSFGDFWERTSVAFLEALKGGVVGGATAGAGGWVKGFAPVVTSRQVAKATMAEVATMVSVGKAIEGQIPSAVDFVEAGILVGGLHASTRVAGKLRGIYAKRGVHPADVIQEAKINPVVKQELLSENIETPALFEIKADEPLAPGETLVLADEPLATGETLVLADEPLAPAETVPALPSTPKASPGNTVSISQALSQLEETIPGMGLEDRPTKVTIEMRSADQMGGLTIPQREELSQRGVKYGWVARNDLVSSATEKAFAVAERRKLVDQIESLLIQNKAEKDIARRLNTEPEVVRAVRTKLGMPLAGGKKGVARWLVERQKVTGGAKGEFKEVPLSSPPVTMASPPEAPPSAPSPAKGPEGSVRSRIVSPVPEGYKPTVDGFLTAVIDDLHPFKQWERLLEGDMTFKADESPYELARLTRGSYGRADQFLKRSPFKFKTLEDVGKSFEKVISPVKFEFEAFEDFAVASRALELAERGIETGVPMEGEQGAKATVERGQSKYGPVLSDLVDFNGHLLNYMVDAGLVTEFAAKEMKELNKSYVPFYRLITPAKELSAGAGLKVRNPLKGIKGSDLPIVSPLESIVKNTYLYIQLAERNRALVKLVEMAERSPHGKEYAERMESPVPSADEVTALLEEHGVESSAEVSEAFDFLRMKHNALRSNEFAVYRNGKREVWRAPQEIVNAVRALDAPSVGLLERLLSPFASSLRAGVTIVPEFAIRNPVRDQFSALVFSRHGFKPVYHTLFGLKELFKKGDAYSYWLKSGGANATMVSMDRDYIQQNVFGLAKDTGLISKAWNVLKSPLEILRATSELLENSTRLGAFENARAGRTDMRSIFNAAVESRDVTTDFRRIGAQTRALNSITAFWNQHMQGLANTAIAFKERPVESMLKAGAAITLPSVLLWLANKDDPRWKDIPRWQKDVFWIVMTKDTVYRIPKPFELGVIFGSLPERALEAFWAENPKAFDDLSDTLYQAFAPAYIPTFAVPVVEQFANRSTFTGAPIVPAKAEKLLPEFQYVEYTTEAGKRLGRLVATVGGETNQLASPMVIENYIRAWSGGLGTYALQLADKVLEGAKLSPEQVKPTPTLADIPFVKAFVVRHPSANSQDVTDFYDRNKRAQQWSATIKKLIQDGDIESLQRKFPGFDQEGGERQAVAMLARMTRLDGIAQALANQHRMLDKVYLSLEMTPDEKRQIVDGLYLGMTKTAEAGNAMFFEIDKVLEANK